MPITVRRSTMWHDRGLGGCCIAVRKKEFGSLVKSVLKAAEILTVLSDSDDNSMSFKEIESRIDMPRSTVHRILATLEYAGFVAQDPQSGYYRLGSRILQLGGRLLSGFPVVDKARPYLEQLAKDCDETVNLGVLDFPSVLYVDVVHGRRLLRSNLLIGTTTFCHCTALGKVLLAFSKDARLESLADEPGLPAQTPRTITSASRLAIELELVRSEGYAVDDEELEVGLKCVAAPVRDHTGNVIAAISASGPAHRLVGAEFDRVLNLLIEATRSISEQLGCPEGNLRGFKTA